MKIVLGESSFKLFFEYFEETKLKMLIVHLRLCWAIKKRSKAVNGYGFRMTIKDLTGV